VLDNTGMATYCQPFKDLPHLSFNIKLIVIESLLKYHQYGLDRVNGGIIYAYDFSSPSLLQTRRNVGTILPDVSVSSLPRPNRNIFDKRMLRIGRNNKNFAQYLDNWIKNNASPIEYIVHPSLPTYQAFERTRKLPFQGGSFVIAFKKSLQSDSFHLRFIKSILAAAKNMNVPIVEGTSFGFDTTRIYLTARFSDGPTASFIRISAGTETQVELTALMGVFTQVLEKAGI
jgi:cystathionine beta-lyase/cystathionine gamma-synthase